MKVINIELPTVEDIKDMPCFKRKGRDYYLLGNYSTSLNTGSGLYSFITEDGALNITGASPSDIERLMITFEKESDEEIIPGQLLEFNGVIYEATKEGKAISLEDIPIEGLFEKEYWTFDPNEGNTFPKGYSINNKVLQDMLEASDRTATIVDIPSYDSKEHIEKGKDLLTDVIKLTYSLRRKTAEERNDSYGVEIYTLTEDKLNKELETPNLFVLSMFNFFASTVIRDSLELDTSIRYILKSNKLLHYTEDLEDISPERLANLKEVIEDTKEVYRKAIKYGELNSQYDVYKKMY